MMFTSLKNTKKGFTLIELLVVIAIIGILSSVVLASLATARQKSRDAKRISDVGQIQLALELFFDANQSYPSTTPSGFSPSVAGGSDAAVNRLTSDKFLPKTPLPPTGGDSTYQYRGAVAAGTECTAAGTACTSYALGTTLERTDNTVLTTDADQTIGTVFYGATGNCVTGLPASPEQCYDIKP